MPTQDEFRQSEYEEMKALLPDIFPDNEDISASQTNSILMSLANELGWLEFNLEEFRDNENALTATIEGIVDWEDIAGLPHRTDLTLGTRRARVYARISGTPCTLETIKQVVKGYVGEDNFEIFEYWTLNDPASAFKYKVIITRPPSTAYDEESLQQDLVRVQPAHCGDYVEIEDKWDNIEDTLTITEGVSATKLQFFVIGSSLIDGPDVIGA